MLSLSSGHAVTCRSLGTGNVLDCNCTPAEGFWTNLKQAVRRDGANIAREQKFADIRWQERWNRSTQEMIVTQSGSQVIVTTFFGMLTADLSRPDDISAIVRKARAFADKLEQYEREYNGHTGTDES